MLTAVEICNRALDKLGADPINSLTSPQLINEKRLARIYPVTKAGQLRRHRWVFAKKEAILNSLSAKTNAGLYQFELPTDCLRPLRNDRTTWERAGSVLRDIDVGPLALDYIADVSETLFCPDFVDVLACKLAEELAEPITQNANKKAQAKQDWLDALADAKRNNAFEVGDEDLHDSDIGFDWLTVRY